MAWSNSKVFRPYLADIMENTTAIDLTADVIRVALYNNNITPNNNVTAANSAYNAGVWVSTGNEVFQAGTWAQKGPQLTSPVVNTGTADAVYFTASNPASGSNATLSNAYGLLVYDDGIGTPVVDQGVCYNYLGGANSVTNGVLTIIWHANGIFRITL